MSGPRWRVHKVNILWWEQTGKWFAVPHEDDSNAGEYFPTHAEAIGYADRMAHTMEVDLGNVKYETAFPPFEESIEPRLVVNVHNDCVVLQDDAFDSVAIEPQDYLPLAKILLAAHYQKETQ